MKRIAVVFNGNLSINRQGQINSAISRIKYLNELGVFEIDAYCIQEYDWGILRWSHHQQRIIKEAKQKVDGIDIRVIFKRKIFLDSVFESVLQLPPLFSSHCFHRIAKLFKDYDLVVGHSTIGGLVAYTAHTMYNLPYCVIWHGSDIHTNPVINKYVRKITQLILSSSSGNIFVSRSLLNAAINVFGSIPEPHIKYNAPGKQFIRYSDDRRATLRAMFGVNGKRIIAYIGNLVPVKNVFALPGIFKQVAVHNDDVTFWVIGDGMHRAALEQMMNENGIACRFWGNLQPEEMPDIMNSIDVLVLPSYNESFGMVLVEAIACGANAVGSNRGGIPEVIGLDNCFELDDTFEEKISDRIVKMLNEHIIQNVKVDFNWNSTAEKEAHLFSEILNR